MNDIQPLWTPSPERVEAANMTRFLAQVNRHHGLDLTDYDALYRWSIDEKEAFWTEVWDFCGIIGERGERVLIDGDRLEQAQWFPDARLNFAENLLRRKDDAVAICFRAEDQVEYQLSYAQLHEQVASVAAWLKSQGLQPGDRVAAYLPNIPEAVVAMLAATSLGAVWTSTSPDFGADSVIDRFGQTEPRFLFTADGYFYNGKRHDLADKIHALALLLIGTSRRSEVVALLEEQLRMKFHADRSVLVLIGSVDVVGGVTGNFLRLADRDDSALGPFRSFLESDSVRCGPVRDAQRDYLFGSDDCEIGSLALIPLGKQSAQGFLAIGSRSAEHFNPGVSIDFLSRLGELVAAALAR